MNKPIVTALCVVAATAVVLSSMHSAQVASAAQLDKQSDNAVIKIHTELHNHVDKSGKVISDMPQIDARSLRLRDHKRHNRFALGNLFDTWRDYFSLFLA